MRISVHFKAKYFHAVSSYSKNTFVNALHEFGELICHLFMCSLVKIISNIYMLKTFYGKFYMKYHEIHLHLVMKIIRKRIKEVYRINIFYNNNKK